MPCFVFRGDCHCLIIVPVDVQGFISCLDQEAGYPRFYVLFMSPNVFCP